MKWIGWGGFAVIGVIFLTSGETEFAGSALSVWLAVCIAYRVGIDSSVQLAGMIKNALVAAAICACLAGLAAWDKHPHHRATPAVVESADTDEDTRSKTGAEAAVKTFLRIFAGASVGAMAAESFRARSRRTYCVLTAKKSADDFHSEP
jgi:hypothetical protein